MFHFHCFFREIKNHLMTVFSHLVSVAYEHLRRSGFIELPHRTTLNKYTGFASSGSGFNVEIIQRLCEDSNITKKATV